MNERYFSKRSWLIYFPLILFPFLMSFGLLSVKNSGEILVVFWIAVPIYIFILTLLKTSYVFEESSLVLRMSFFRKRIPLDSITKVTIGNHVWFAGWKYALSTKGIVLSYTKYNEVLISPEKQEEFIEALKKINPQLVVEEKN